jgi:hypothetical protein
VRIALLLKLAVLGLLIVAAFDGANLVRTAYGADRDAESAAIAASQTYRSTKNVQLAYDAAVAAINDPEAVVDPQTFSADEDGVVRLTVHRKSDSVVLRRVHEQWTEIAMSSNARPPSS